MKFYDTCALLDNFETMPEEKFIISSITLAELEKIKTSTSKDSEVKYIARKILSFLNANPEKYEVVLYKNVNGKCGEHYTVKDENGKVVVYNTNEKGEEVLYEETSISTEYLTENDVENIKKGIEIYGKQNLNSFIEDFE